jgi:hypothetical protein
MLPGHGRLVAGATFVWLVAGLAGCGGITAPRDAVPGDAGDLALDDSGDGSVSIDASVDATTVTSDDAAPQDSAAYGPEGNGPTSSDAHVCSPATCATLGYDCGYAADGCGGLLQCGSCVAPQFCGGGGFDRCGGCGSPDCCAPAEAGGGCPPLTCLQLGIACGPAGDGCGGLIECGTCPSGQTCGGAGVAGQCGVPDAGLPPCCAPTSCAEQHIDCGPAGDGCGGILQCGQSTPCTPPRTCGGGGFGRCG